MNTKFCTIVTLLLASQVVAKTFSDSDFKGNYAWSLSGFFTQNVDPSFPPNGTTKQIGIYRPDGFGVLDPSPCKTIINGNRDTLFVGFLNGTYSVDVNGMIEINTTLFETGTELIISQASCRGVLANGQKLFQFFTVPPEVPEGFTLTIDQFGSAVKQNDD
uniref:Uncharacterized protein n=1 Tax=Pithovirus LCPAC403 TaxID=2506596 RepID=A0A481ZFP5_9VIRU|nr:MAG: hypothetical protein LCPAC403_04150 [Pithovirus LCPAC403]